VYREVLGQFSGIVEIIANHAKSVDSIIDRYMRTAALGIVAGLGCGKTKIEKRS